MSAQVFWVVGRVAKAKAGCHGEWLHHWGGDSWRFYEDWIGRAPFTSLGRAMQECWRHRDSGASGYRYFVRKVTRTRRGRP